jgi:transcriptional regulator of acetoin/glycerol metabolism
MDTIREKEMKKAWEDFFHHNKMPSVPVDEVIMESWLRCKKLDVPFDHTVDEIRAISPNQLDQLLKNKQSIIDIVTPYLKKLFNIVKEAECIVALTDENGIVLKSICDDLVLKNFPTRAATPGRDFSERVAGTNAIGTALYLNRPIQIWGKEHYNIQSHEWVCSAAPIHDQNKEIIGCLLISCLTKNANIFSLGMVTSAVDAIETQLKIHNYIHDESTTNKELRFALNYISDGVIIINIYDYVVYINEYCKEMLGLKNMDLIGHSIYNLIKNYQEIEQFLHCPDNVKPKSFLIKTNSRTVNCKLSVKRFNNENDEHQGYILYVSAAKSTSKLIRQRSVSKAAFRFEHIVGNSETLGKTIEYAKIMASSDSNVLIIGESGTGKELFAQSIHNYSTRKNEPFVPINCAAISKSLIESELFGYVGGAFTGAKAEGQPGKFELADGGTIFLDEIGDMPLETQATLLRVLQEKEFTRIGGKEPIKIDVRVIAATNKDLEKAIEHQEFRLDLYYRLNVFQLRVPPLRERVEDITELASYFVRIYSAKSNKNIYGIDAECISALQAHFWPGNVRELENIIERAVNFSKSNYVTLEDLDFNYSTNPTGIIQEDLHSKSNCNDIKINNRRDQIINLLEKYEGNVTEVAKHLGIARKTLYARIKKYDIDVEKYRY